MKNLKLLFGFIFIISYGCTPSDESVAEAAITSTDIVTLTYGETARWSDTQNLLVEDFRELSKVNDIFTWGELGKISRNEYPLISKIEYNEREKSFKFVYPGYLNNSGDLRLLAGVFKIKSSYIEQEDEEILGALILILEDDATSENLKVMFIDKGVVGLVNKGQNLVQISGIYKYITPNSNSYFNKNFFLCFHTKEKFSVNNTKIILN